MGRFIHGLVLFLLLASHVAAGVASAATEVRVLFVLERQRDDLATLAHSVSDPSSSSYGDYWDVEDIGGTYGASNQTIDQVGQFLDGKVVAGSIYFDATKSFGYALLTEQAAMAIFGSVPTSPFPDVPAALAGSVTHIVGAFDCLGAADCSAAKASFQEPPQDPEPPPFSMRRAYERAADGLSGVDPWPSWAMGSGTPEDCPVMTESEGSCENSFTQPSDSENANSRSFTPKQLRTAYGFEASGFTGQGRAAVILVFGQAVVLSDIDSYATGFGLAFRSNSDLYWYRWKDIPEYRSTNKNLEITLDVETIVGLAKGVDRITVVAGPSQTTGQILTYFPLMASRALDKFISGGVVPDVISMSLGVCEDAWISSGADVMIEALEIVFQTAAAAGVTVIFSSGDTGSSDCASREAPTPWAPNAEAVHYPASSPWVTAVGGTNLRLNADNSIAEAQVWNDWPLVVDKALSPNSGNPCDVPPCRVAPSWAGGGGVSTHFDAPSWQQNTGHSKRSVPDIAYMADIYPGTLLYHDDKWRGAGNGTSLAAPTFAAAVLLLNEFREKNNKPRIGFANPLLYSLGKTKPEVYHDVVQGNNKIGNNTTQFTQLTCCDAGTGWDAATGWGSLLIDRATHAFRESEGASVSLVGLAAAPGNQGLAAHGENSSTQIFNASTGDSFTHPFASSISGVYTQLTTVDSFDETTGLESTPLATFPAGAHAEPGHGLSWIELTDTDANAIFLSAMGFKLDILSSSDYHFEPATNIETRIYRGGTISLFEDAEGVATEILSYSDAVATMVIDWKLHGSGTPNITVDVELPIGLLQIHSTETIQVDGITEEGSYGVFDILGADLSLVPEPSPVLAAAAALLTLLALRRRLRRGGNAAYGPQSSLENPRVPL